MRTISVVVPLFNSAPLLERVLTPLAAAAKRGEILEILIVDDGSTDDGPDTCRARGLELLSSGGHLGPGAARNVGVEAARGDIVLFVDADVVIHDDVPSIVRETFEAYPDCVAVFGSYDDRPAARGFVSTYVNLRHHCVHQAGNPEASTFWAACGAADRRAFTDAGGYDIARFERSSIEDIELGQRLRRRGGRILLRKDMLCTHLKRWTLRDMVVTEIFRRALPWGRLMMQPGYLASELNVSTRERWKAGLALLLVASVLAAPFYAPLGLAALAFAVLAFRVNRRLFRLILKRRGWAAMLVGVALHQLYYLYSSLTYGYCVLESAARGPVR